MRPVLENGLVDALRLMQVSPVVARYSRVQNMVMAALDHVDRVDLHITKVLDGEACCRRSGSEWFANIQPLGSKPNAPGLARGELKGLRHQSAVVVVVQVGSLGMAVSRPTYGDVGHRGT